MKFDPELISELRSKIYSTKEALDARPAELGLVPLKIKCLMASCGHGRHCLDHLRRPSNPDVPVSPGSCRDCAAPVVIMPETHQYGDPDELISTCLNQQHELIRAHYWRVPIDLWAYNQALRLGRAELGRRIKQQVEYAMTSTDVWAGRAAPYSKSIIGYAQHATATCCRSCAAYWHGLPRDGTGRRDPPAASWNIWCGQLQPGWRFGFRTCPRPGNQSTAYRNPTYRPSRRPCRLTIL